MASRYFQNPQNLSQLEGHCHPLESQVKDLGSSCTAWGSSSDFRLHLVEMLSLKNGKIRLDSGLGGLQFARKFV